MSESLSIILPVFNEEKVIKTVISNIVAFCRENIDNFDVIAVDDGSTDFSRELLRKQQYIYPELKVMSHKRNRGYGCAIRLGIAAAQSEWVFIMDADGQFQIDDFQQLWQYRHDHDCVIGYRKKRQDSLYRIILGKTGNLMANLALRKNIRDINCGFKLFKTNLLKGCPLRSTGNLIYLEILNNLFKRSIKFKQLPVRHYKRELGIQTGGSPKTIGLLIWEGVKFYWNEISKNRIFL